MTKHISLVLAALHFSGCGITDYNFNDLTPFDGVFAGSESFELDIAGIPDKPSFGSCRGDIVVDVQSDAVPQVLGQGTCTVDPGGGGWSYVLTAKIAAYDLQGQITLTDGESVYTLPVDGWFDDDTLHAAFGDSSYAGADGSFVDLKGGFVATRD